MMSQIKRYDTPSSYAAPPDGSNEVWAYNGSQYLHAKEMSGTLVHGPQHNVETPIGRPDELLQRKQWVGVVAASGEVDEQATKNRWHRSYSKIFRYRALTPLSELDWMHDFIRGPAHDAGTLPTDWTEQDVVDSSGTHTHALCTFTATVEAARRMKYIHRANQSSIKENIAAGVAMVQDIVDVGPAFDGWKSNSQLPTALDETLYAPGEVFQLIAPGVWDPSSDPDNEDPRGTALPTSDFLSAYDLAIL